MSKEKSPTKSYLATAILAGTLMGGLSGAHAASPGFFDQSLASQLVQSMTQRRILQNDDATDAACKSRTFTEAMVVQQPVVQNHGGYSSKSWQEDWTLSRCGSDVFYRVFYSEVGAGGITFSVAQLDSAGMAVVQPTIVQPEAPLLRLTKPYMRGDDVKTVQAALRKAGVSVSVDGVFGPGTHKAVMAFQKEKGLQTDGEVGKTTRDALGL